MVFYDDLDFVELVARPINLETTMARYPIPQNCSSMTSTREAGAMGRISPNPVAERLVKLRERNSTKVIDWPGLVVYRKLSGIHV